MPAIACVTVALVATATIARAETADRHLYARICSATPCGGTFGRLQLFRDKGGTLALILARGDFRVCSHPPAVYLDAKGAALESIDDWLRIDKDSARTAEQFHARMTGGLTRAEEIMCSDACKAPTRPDPNDTQCRMP